MRRRSSHPSRRRCRARSVGSAASSATPAPHGASADASPATAETARRNHGVARRRGAPRRPGEDAHPDRQPTARGAHQPDSRWSGRNLDADHAAELLRGVRPRDATGKTMRALAMDLVSEARQLDRRIAKAATDIQTAVTASATTLTDLHGLGALTAGKILAASVTLAGSGRRPRSPATPAPPRSRCPPATWSATGFPAPAIAN